MILILFWPAQKTWLALVLYVMVMIVFCHFTIHKEFSLQAPDCAVHVSRTRSAECPKRRCSICIWWRGQGWDGDRHIWRTGKKTATASLINVINTHTQLNDKIFQCSLLKKQRQYLKKKIQNCKNGIFILFQRGRLPGSLLEPIDFKTSTDKKDNVIM